MRKRVIITGGAGRIGTIINEDLGGKLHFTLIDIMSGDSRLVVNDLCTYPSSAAHSLRSVFEGKDAVIHLAWDSRENWKSTDIIPTNKLAAENIYEAAVQFGVPRVIMASSIHAHGPDSLYGASKLYIEALGRYYATKHGLEVICVRFGGVDPQDLIREQEPNYRQIMLTRRDCASLIHQCLEVPEVPGKFCLFNGVSRTVGRVYDWANPLGWAPQDDCSKL